MNRPYRIGQIVPSSNTTMETEIPAMLRAREVISSTSVCTVWDMLTRLNLPTHVPDAGRMLSGAIAAPAAIEAA